MYEISMKAVSTGEELFYYKINRDNALCLAMWELLKTNVTQLAELTLKEDDDIIEVFRHEAMFDAKSKEEIAKNAFAAIVAQYDTDGWDEKNTFSK